MAADTRRPEGLPHRIPLDLSASVGELYEAKIRQVFHDTYAGVPLLKFPEDLRIYEHLLWLNRVEVVVELGTFRGGSALWFRDRLRTLSAYGLIGAPRVITVDIEIGGALDSLGAADPTWREQIELHEGDVCDPALARMIKATVPPGASCLVVDDSAHTHRTTMGALEGYSELIAPGGFFVVEDTVNDIEEMRASEGWPTGVLPGIEEWLATPQGQDFEIRREVEAYGVSCFPWGFLRRRAPAD